MAWLFRTPETITPDLVASDELTADDLIDTGSHCAWCGDPPDANGSHGICEAHAEQQYAAYRELKAARR